MLTIFQKELNAFFSSLMAYVIVGFFLILMGLLLWVFPETNVIDKGYADLQPFFRLGPYVLMFFIPAITMGLLAEEKKIGTLEVLLASPLPPVQIILGKYLASLMIIFITLLLTSTYYFCIYYLASPLGNIDTAAILGSYLGLIMLAAVFAAIGLGTSVLTKSQIIAFLLATLLCFLLYHGIDAWTTLQTWKSYSLVIAQLGLYYHYEALSRGVIDLRDICYFLSVIIVLLATARIALNYSEVKINPSPANKKFFLTFLWITISIGGINILGNRFLVRIDLTEDQRHHIHPATKNILSNLQGEVRVEIYLAGDLPIAFKQLQRAIQELLEECKIYANSPIHYQVIDPNTVPLEECKKLVKKLIDKGIQPTNLYVREHNQRSEKIIYPGVLITYQAQEIGAMLLKGNQISPPEQMISQSIENLEYELAKALAKLINKQRAKVALVKGHGEPHNRQLHGLVQALNEHYECYEVELVKTSALTDYGALLITKPQQPFSEEEKYLLDQYIMQGGRVLFFLSCLRIDIGGLRSGQAFATPLTLNLDDQLFRYGIRINKDLIQDLHAGVYPVIAGKMGNQPQLRLLPWPFFPIINNFSSHLITKNIDALYIQFVSSLDTVKAAGVAQIPLAFTSSYTRRLHAPIQVDLASFNKSPKLDLYNQGLLPVIYLLEGRFTSLYKNRMIPPKFDAEQFIPTSQPTKLLVAASGSLVLNAVNPQQGQPYPWGYDPFVNRTFANEDLVLNTLAYMLDEEGLINAKRKALKIRLLDKLKVEQTKLVWQLVNIIVPLILLLIIAIVWNYIYKRIFTQL